MVVAPVASLCDTRRGRFAVGLADPVGGSPPVDDGEPVVVVDPDPEVVDPPAAESVPGGSDAVGEPLDDGPVDDPVSGDSVCVVVPDPESPDPVVSAEATVGAEAIATPAPSATASAPTRPI